MKKAHILLIIIMFIGFNCVFAQEKQTDYQKKIIEITQKYLKILNGNNNTSLNIYQQMQLGLINNSEVNSEVARYILGIAIYIYSENHTDTEVKRISDQIESELKQAEKLKTVVDYQREKDAIAKKEREDKVRKIQEQQAQYLKTDIGIVKKNIKIAFEKWNQKGEFEKETDYQERLRTKSHEAFSKICINEIKRKIYYSNIKKELSTYDSENELFIVTFVKDDITCQAKINIPISNAAVFKEKWNNLNFVDNQYDWSFVGNNLFPTLITLEDSYANSKYNFPLLLKNQSVISFSFDEFEIVNPYLKGFVFRYSDAKKIEEEEIRIILEQYNQKLDSVYRFCNRKLLENPYNIVKDTIKQYRKMEFEANLKDVFNDYKNEIELNFKNLNDNFSHNLIINNPDEFFKIYYALNPERKIEADKKYLDCKCGYPTRTKFDKDYISNYLNSCRCRRDLYDRSGYLFISKNEFDSFYDKGDSVINEEIRLRYSKKEVENVIRNLKSEISTVEKIDYKKENNKYYIDAIEAYKQNPYYSDIIDFIIETNKELSKEWLKHGKFFNNKTEFFEAYISKNYKQLLKEKSIND